MKTLTIGDTVCSLAYLISVKYKAKSKEAPRRRVKSETVESPQILKSASSLDLRFLDCETIHLKKEKADAVWKKLSIFLELDPDDNQPAADDSHPS